MKKKTVCSSSGTYILMGLGKTVNLSLNSLSCWTNSAVKLKQDKGARRVGKLSCMGKLKKKKKAH